MGINLRRGDYMSKGALMKISAIIISAITIYTVIIWEPKSVDSISSEQISNSNNIVSEVDNTAFQLDKLEDIDSSNYNYSSNENNLTEGLGTVIIEQKSFEDIIKEVNSKERDEIDKVLRNLSITDYSKVDKLLSQKNSSKGINEAFEFIRKRLSIEDYRRFEEIISKYIDITNIDSNI